VPGADFKQGDAEELPFEDDSFDAVVSGFGVIHVPQPAKALAEFRRVARPGGFVAISTWQAPKPSNGFGLVFGALKSHGDLNVPLPHGPDMFQFSEIDRMKAALTEVGLVDVTAMEVEQAWDLEHADALLDGFLEATVRGSALLRGQTEESSQAIREAVSSGMKSFGPRGSRYRVPMPAVIGVGRK
jgi:SAM-dependent methyltransferase